METAADFLPATGELEEEFDPVLEGTLAFEEAARRLDLEDWIAHRLRQPEREITLHLPRLARTGEPGAFTAFRVEHSTARGPALGGVCLRPDAHLGEVKAEAMFRTWQCALLDLPLGGGAGAVVCDPQRLPERDLRALVQDYVWALGDVIGSSRDVLAAEEGSNDHIMAWMWSAYARARGPADPGAILGRPPALGTSTVPLHPGAQSLGTLLQEALADLGVPLQGQRVAIQGFGETGAALASWLFEGGARVVALNDLSGGLYREQGLEIPAVRAFAQRTGMLFGYPEAEAVGNTDVLEAACDVLVPAAGEKQLTARNAARIQAGIVLEAARGAITRVADRALAARRVLVVPDLLAGSGCVLAGFLEWVQNLRGNCWPPAEAEEFLRRRLQTAYAKMKEAACAYGIPFRQAAELLAVERVAAVLRLQ